MAGNFGVEALCMRRSYYCFAISISTICLMENEHANAFHTFEHDGWQKAAAQYDPGFGAVTSQSVGSLLDAVGARDGWMLRAARVTSRRLPRVWVVRLWALISLRK
jgi:hypothetical protein